MCSQASGLYRTNPTFRLLSDSAKAAGPYGLIDLHALWKVDESRLLAVLSGAHEGGPPGVTWRASIN